MSNSLIARAFVTTFAVGNSQGYSVGQWFDLEDYSDKDEFMAAAYDYAKTKLGDNDPELCFSDYELEFNSPVKQRNLISENGISPTVWDLFDMSDRDIEILEAFLDNSDMVGDSLTDTLEKAQNNHAGEYESLEDYARQYLENSGEMDTLSDIVLNSIDFTDMGRRLTDDMNVCGNHYFYNV